MASALEKKDLGPNPRNNRNVKRSNTGVKGEAAQSHHRRHVEGIVSGSQTGTLAVVGARTLVHDEQGHVSNLQGDREYDFMFPL